MGTTAQREIVPRDIAFALDRERAADWLNGRVPRTAFANALSLLFPAGERFFIASVAAYRERITDPDLRARVRAFVSQEALHTREHAAYNEALETIVDARVLEQAVSDHLEWIKQTFSPLVQLATTCALEHFTAVLAQQVLKDPAYLAGSVPCYQRLWTWHALEESEHKSVAFDVFRAVAPRGTYRLRVRSMALATRVLVSFTSRNIGAIMRARGLARSPMAWLDLANFLLGRPGLVRRITLPYLRYYVPGFHPDDVDDRVLIARGRRLVEGAG